MIGVDKVRMDELPNHTFIQGDIREPQTLGRVMEVLGGKSQAHVVMSGTLL